MVLCPEYGVMHAINIECKGGEFSHKLPCPISLHPRPCNLSEAHSAPSPNGGKSRNGVLSLAGTAAPGRLEGVSRASRA